MTVQQDAASAILGSISTHLPDMKGIDAPTQAVDTKAPTDTKAEAPKVDERVSSKLSVLMQREKAALEAERRSKETASQTESRLKGIEEREAKLKQFEELKTTNPMRALELLGLNYQELTQVALADGNVTPDIQVKKVEEKLDNYLKAQEAEKERAALELKRADEQRLVDTELNFKSKISTYVTDNKAKYQLIDFEGQTGLIFDVIDAHYNNTMDKSTGVGKVMSIEEAADKVEAWLEKRDEERRGLDKIKAKLPQMAPQKQITVDASQFKTPVQKPTRTLTNQQSATPSRQPTKMLTDDERVAKAVAYAHSIRR